MVPGAATLVNVATVLLGATLGVLAGHRLSARTRDVVTDALGLVTLLVAAGAASAISSSAWSDAVGDSAPTLIVLGALVLGGVIGSALGIERALEGFGSWFRGVLVRRVAHPDGAGTGSGGARAAGADMAATDSARGRFVEGFVASSLVFCVGPLTVLGSLNDGLGNGPDQLLLKSALDGFAAIAFAASFGWGVAASAVSVLVIQGSLTLVGLGLGNVLPEAHVAALTATGGLMLVGVALRLLRVRQVPVGDLLPALVLAPLMTELVLRLR